MTPSPLHPPLYNPLCLPSFAKTTLRPEYLSRRVSPPTPESALHISFGSSPAGGAGPYLAPPFLQCRIRPNSNCRLTLAPASPSYRRPHSHEPSPIREPAGARLTRHYHTNGPNASLARTLLFARRSVASLLSSSLSLLSLY